MERFYPGLNLKVKSIRETKKSSIIQESGTFAIKPYIAALLDLEYKSGSPL